METVDDCTKYHLIAASDSFPTTHTHTHTVMEYPNGTVQVEVLGKILSKETTPSLCILDELPHNTSFRRKVELISQLKICAGNSDQSFLKLADKAGNFYTITKKLVAKIDHNTIRHANCTMLIKEGKRCPACEKHRNSLRVKLSRLKKRNNCETHAVNLFAYRQSF